MSARVEFEVFDPTSNAVVARSPDREFPGVLIQGDTLRVLFDDLLELAGLLEDGGCDEALEVSQGLAEQVGELLRHYEKVLKSSGVSLPYPQSVSVKK